MGESLLTPLEEAQQAPPWFVQRWLGAPEGFGLPMLRGRLVALHAFQMLCPGCVSHGIPQMQRIAARFSSDDVAVVGLHTVFEHHAAMTPISLRAFLHEYRVDFPVGIDDHDEGNPTPKTMKHYRFEGTPSLVLIDREGRIRSHVFGRLDDLQLGIMLGTLLSEAVVPSVPCRPPHTTSDMLSAAACSSDICTASANTSNQG